MKSLAWLLILVTVWSIPLYAESKRPDERILWQLFHARKYRLLKQALTEYQKQYPNWQPPAELMRWLSASRRPTHAPWQAVLKATLRRSDYPQLRQLAKRYPQAFGCHSGDALLAVAAAYAHVKDEEAAFAWYQKALRCFDLPARDVLDHALWQLTPHVFSRLLDSARTHLTASTYEEFVYQNTKRRILSTLQHPQAYLTLDPTFLDQAVAHRDVDAILAIAWALQQREDFAQARAWFEAGLKLAPKHEGLASGLLQSLIRLRQDQAVLDAGERYPKLRQIAGGYLLMRAWEYYRQGNYTLSQRLVEPAAQWLSEAEEANYLLGWLAFQRRDYVQAKQIFEALFLAHPERKDYAHALVTTWLQSGADLDHLAERFPQAVIQTELAPYRARRAYERKQFLRAYLTDPQGFAELGRLTAPDWGMGGMARFKSGQAGLDRLTIAHAPWYGGNYTLGTHRFGLHLSRIELHSSQLGSAGIRRFQGSKTLNLAQRTALEQEVFALRRRPPPNSIEAAWLELSYRLEGKLNPYFQLGLTPIGGQFSPQPTARLGISDWLDSSAWKLYWHVETYRQPVRQSLLSYTGSQLLGKSWGQVLRNGITLSGLLQIGRLSIYQALDSAFLDGQGTKDNWTLSYALAPNYNLPWARLDYLSIGPYFHFMHYAHNQNHFRPGHGGYFSPQIFYAGGIQLGLRTEEGKRFMLAGRLAAGVQHFRESAAPWFPRGCNNSPLCGLKFPKNRETSFAPSGELRFAWQIHPFLQFTGGVYARKTQGWREAGGGLFLRFLFAPAKSIISDDFPEPLFSSLE